MKINRSNVGLVSPAIWQIYVSPWKWCLFSELLEAANRIVSSLSGDDNFFTAEQLWKRFFDLSDDIGKDGSHQLQWTVDGEVFKHVVKYVSTPDLPKESDFFVPAGWCMRIMKAVQKGGRRVEDSTPHPNGKFPKKRWINVFTQTGDTFRFKE
jgi:hypothetical protein